MTEKLICKRCNKEWTGVLSHILFCKCLWFLGEKKDEQ